MFASGQGRENDKDERGGVVCKLQNNYLCEDAERSEVRESPWAWRPAAANHVPVGGLLCRRMRLRVMDHAALPDVKERRV